MTKLLMRRSEPDDVPAIMRLLDEAFAPSEYESGLVGSLIGTDCPVHQ